jgi:flagellar assembly protein FliH
MEAEETEVLCRQRLSTAREEASRLMSEAAAQARAEARRLTGDAEAQAEALRVQAREEGLAKGMEQARRDTEALFAKAQTEVDETLREAVRQRDELLDSMEPRIFKLALEIAEKILGYELDHNESAFLSMLRAALGSVKSESHVTLRVNPSEYVRFFKSREVTMHTQSGSIQAQVVNDPTVGYGGCLIETESGLIDAGADAQLKQIAKNLGVEDD